ncbi:hypothetical protein [Ciceribacter sp. RN22]|uniref:hypothetical protein n=1 Tax=Ciceribacter sp. RN22 TaxID=2954932 RepID=UPI0020924032|nr:hypothetical protein [Ciceribacter sp. RN22]MCO6178448.1 hypothetical protein [Ciceribacter sp. RN22]
MPDEPYLFLPLQFYGAEQLIGSASIDMIRATEIAVDWAAGTKRPIVIKRHPQCDSSAVAALMRRLEQRHGVTVSNARMPDLLAGAWAVLPGNSGVGMQAAILLKGSIVTGTVDYLPVSVRVHAEDELASVLASYTPPSADTIKAFLVDYFGRYCVDWTSPVTLGNTVARFLADCRLHGSKDVFN